MAGRTRQRGLTATSRAMAIQRRDPQSLLNWTGRIIRMRKEVPEVGWGDFAVVPTEKTPPGHALLVAKQLGPVHAQFRR